MKLTIGVLLFLVPYLGYARQNTDHHLYLHPSNKMQFGEAQLLLAK